MGKYYHDFPFKGYEVVKVPNKERYHLIAVHPTASTATPQNDTRAYAEFIKAAYNETAGKQGGRFSMYAQTQAPRNETQQDVYNKFQDFCLEIITFCIEKNVVLLPGSYLMNFLNLAMVSIDNPKAHLYWEEYLQKIGNTGCGDYRTTKYKEQFKASGIDVDPSLMSCMDVSNLPVHIQVELTQKILDGLARFVPDDISDTCTFEQALEMEMKGLPIMSQLTFWSMIKSLVECKMLGGAVELQSFLKRLYLNVLESVEQDGGVAAIDWDKIGMSVTGMSLVKYIMKRRPFGEEGPRWFIHHRYKGVTVLKMNHSDKRLRVIFVFCAFCNIIFSKTGDKKASDIGTLISSEKSACSAQWMCVVFDTAHENATVANPTLKANRSLSRPIYRNILFAFSMFQHDILNNHTGKKPAALKAKGWIDGKSHFSAKFTCLRKKDHSNIVSQNGRVKLRRGVKDVHRDMFFKQELVCLLSRGRDEAAFQARMREAVEQVLKRDRLDNNAVMGSGGYKRHQYFIESGIIFGEGEKLYKKTYESLRDNSGNTESHHSSSKSTISMVDTVLTDMAVTGRKVFVQAEGSADNDNGPTWPGGIKPFEWPAEGTVIECEPNSNHPPVTFRRADALEGIAFRGVEGRTKRDVNGTGKTNMMQSKKFLDYTLMARYSSSKFHFINKYNIVEIWLVKTSEMTDTQAGRTYHSEKSVTDEYEEKFANTVSLFRSNDLNVDAFKVKEPLVVLLWCGFNKFYRANNKKAALPNLKTWLKEKIAKGESTWLEDAIEKYS